MPSQNKTIDWIPANWPAPNWIKAGTTTRLGGHSAPPYDSLNLALHVDDKPDVVEQNRQILPQKINLPSLPLWLRQTHSNYVIDSSVNNTTASGLGTTTDAAMVHRFAGNTGSIINIFRV